MHTGKEVDEEVSSHSGSVVLIISPAEKPYRIVGNFWCISEKILPIYSAGLCIGRNGVLPRATTTLPVVPCFYQHQVTDHAGFKDLTGFSGDNGTYTLASYLKNFPSFL